MMKKLNIVNENELIELENNLYTHVINLSHEFEKDFALLSYHLTFNKCWYVKKKRSFKIVPCSEHPSNYKSYAFTIRCNLLNESNESVICDDDVFEFSQDFLNVKRRTYLRKSKGETLTAIYIDDWEDVKGDFVGVLGTLQDGES